MNLGETAPELDVSEWLGSPQLLEDLRGRIVLLEAFQMLCPGCVSHALPQVARVRAAFPDVVVLGLHTVFEHHEAMTPTALRAFASEYRLGFPIGVDRHDGQSIPVTMRRYRLDGTPSTVLIDREGRVRLSAFGMVEDLALGARLGVLLAEPASSSEGPAPQAPTCTPGVPCL